MIDFTFKKYKILLDTLQRQGFSFQTLEQFIENPKEKVVILRHDVDRLPNNAFQMAELEHNMNIHSSYYFRNGRRIFKHDIIHKIVELGHEIGYHYENMDTCKGNIEKSYEDFLENLERFKKFYPIKTICMHGSPLSKWDNRTIWEVYNYKKLNIIAEPYFDIDYNSVFYITDTGRKWNNETSSVRDKVKTKFDIKIHSTKELIKKIKNEELPDKIMINTHPHRWFDFGFFWLKELLCQNVKNLIKRYVIIRNG